MSACIYKYCVTWHDAMFIGFYRLDPCYTHYVLNVPYNPQSNPVESYFNQLKHYLKLDSKIQYKDISNYVTEIPKCKPIGFLYEQKIFHHY